LLQEIDREIAQLLTTIEEHQAKIAILYNRYREAIGKAVAKQLIQGSYLICTREYPQAFLLLSIGQRQDLQGNLQNLARDSAAEVTEKLTQLPTAELLNSEPLDKLLQELLDRACERINQLLIEWEIIPADPPKQMRLRAVEVEYIDREVMSLRSEIRVLGGRCQHLQSQLVKKQQARQIAEAEQAWHLTWVSQGDFLP
jgi:hypothetical protein